VQLALLGFFLFLVLIGMGQKEYLSIKRNADNLCFSCMGLE